MANDLVVHLTRITPLTEAGARRVVEEVITYFDEPLEDVIRRRHRELHAAGAKNEVIYRRIAAELHRRPVAARKLSERQIRRVIYG
ncbi:MAG TPA: hypothetical protein VG368_05830 [Acidimicrobiales bacterium]|nr:hypothetical protein [Acidimicrobiales bacterium]